MTRQGQRQTFSWSRETEQNSSNNGGWAEAEAAKILEYQRKEKGVEGGRGRTGRNGRSDGEWATRTSSERE